MSGLFGGIFRFLFGAALGAGLGITAARLLAPASFAELQRRVNRRLGEARDAGERAERETVTALEQSYQARTRDRGQ